MSCALWWACAVCAQEPAPNAASQNNAAPENAASQTNSTPDGGLPDGAPSSENAAPQNNSAPNAATRNNAAPENVAPQNNALPVAPNQPPATVNLVPSPAVLTAEVTSERPRPFYKKPWFWLALAGGAAVVATGIGLAIVYGIPNRAPNPSLGAVNAN